MYIIRIKNNTAFYSINNTIVSKHFRHRGGPDWLWPFCTSLTYECFVLMNVYMLKTQIHI